MKPVHISPDFGIVIRRSALDERKVLVNSVFEVMEGGPLDSNEGLLSFGPHFGGEAAEEFSRRLERLGLSRNDDFFVFEGGFPPWCDVFCEANS
jgi:hypothetical protein